jgi:DNA-binding transcriptional MerR regulator
MKHPIRVVAARTGLSTHVIRVWERRYGAVTPTRTDTNRRLYTEANIERLNLLQRAIKRGRGIGQIARLSTEELSRLVAEDQALSREEPAVGETGRFEPRMQGRRSEEEIVSACLNAIEALDAPALDRILSQAAVVFSKPFLLQNILMPLLYIIGDQWRDGILRIAHEHIASAVIRSFLSGLSHTYSPATGAPGIIVTTPAGQLHEIGALMIADVATAAGWKITYLGNSGN